MKKAIKEILNTPVPLWWCILMIVMISFATWIITLEPAEPVSKEEYAYYLRQLANILENLK